MGNMINMLAFYLTISIFLYSAQVGLDSGKIFADDLVTNWVQTDTEGEIGTALNDNVSSAYQEVTDYGKSGSTSGTNFFNFWDALQMFWSFVKMLINVFFTIPVSLLQLAIPSFIKLFFVIMVIMGIAVFVLGMMNKR